MVQKHTVPFFVPLWKKTEQWCKKRNSGTKTHCSVVVFPLWKKRNSGAKNGTVVQKHTVPFFVPLWKNSGAKNGTVVQKHTVPFFVPLWKKRNSGAKTEQWYKNTLFRFLFCCGKNGTEVQKTEQWFKNTLFRFFSVVEKNGTVVQKNGTVPWGCLRFVIVVFPDHTHLLFLQKRNSDTKTHSVSFCSVVSCEKNWTYLAYFGFNLNVPKLAFLYVLPQDKNLG